MKKQTIITIASLALPIIGLVILFNTMQAPDKPTAKAQTNKTAAAATQPKKPAALSAAERLQNYKERTSKRLAALEKMKQADWEQEGRDKPDVKRAATLQQALKINRARLAKLNSMTVEEFEAQTLPKKKR